MTFYQFHSIPRNFNLLNFFIAIRTGHQLQSQKVFRAISTKPNCMGQWGFAITTALIVRKVFSMSSAYWKQTESHTHTPSKTPSDNELPIDGNSKPTRFSLICSVKIIYTKLFFDAARNIKKERVREIKRWKKYLLIKFVYETFFVCLLTRSLLAQDRNRKHMRFSNIFRFIKVPSYSCDVFEFIVCRCIWPMAFRPRTGSRDSLFSTSRRNRGNIVEMHLIFSSFHFQYQAPIDT